MGEAKEKHIQERLDAGEFGITDFDRLHPEFRQKRD